MGRHIRDLTAQRFGRLFVLHEAGRTIRGEVMWECLCDCGKVSRAQAGNLLWGHTKSCGCGKNGDAHPSEFIARAREYWDSGYSASEISKRLGVTKNVIIGVAHRNNFTPRPSPIRKAA